MESTTRNMWKLIYDRKCGAVVMLTDLIEDGMVRGCHTNLAIINNAIGLLIDKNIDPELHIGVGSRGARGAPRFLRLKT